MNSWVEVVNTHWFLSFLLVYSIIYGVLGLVSRTYRFVLILFKGWPPSHLDADGEWKPKPDSKK